MIISFLKDLLFPIECLGCQQAKYWLCPSCFKQLKFSCPPRALTGLHAPSVDKIFIAGDYEDGLLAIIIKKYKYNFIENLGPLLGHFLSMFWSGQLLLSGQLSPGPYPQLSYNSPWLTDFMLLPLPLAPPRYRWRGFNQTEALAQALVKDFGYQKLEGLKRKNLPQSQSALSARDRQENVRESFYWRGQDLSGKNIILIDDVVTTGATLEAAAGILKHAGANLVYSLVLAKG